jgi:hypothetical protein
VQAAGPVEERIPLLHNEGNAGTAGIFRVLRDGGSRILKVARPATLPLEPDSPATTSAWQTSTDPTHFNYWRREVEAYASGFAADAYADAGIRTPELLETVTREDGCIELWLEDVEGRSAFEMSPERLGRFGYELGVGQARWAGRVPTQAEVPWLSRGWLAQYLGHGPGANVHVEDSDWDDPAVHAWSPETRRALRGLWESRRRVLADVEALPRTLCHLDCWPANIIEDASGTSVLIDWAFVGEGAIGEDPANLIVDSVTDGLMDISLLSQIADEVNEGYIRGLADGGRGGREKRGGRRGTTATTDTAAVRQAIATCAVAKYGWLGAIVLATTVRGSKNTNAYSQDGSAAEALTRLTPLADLLAQWAESVVR